MIMTTTTDLDFINICGPSSGGQCGYCKNSSDKKSSYGMTCKNMKPDTYAHLMNRGWRRCGTYFYKPYNESTCCPLYTIRCDTDKFQLSQSQRKVLKNFRRFLSNGKEKQTAKKNHEKKQPLINARGDEQNPPEKSPKTPEEIVETAQKPSGKTSHKSKRNRYERKLESLRNRSRQSGESFESLFAEYQSRRQKRLDKNRPQSLRQLLDQSTIAHPKHRLSIRTIRCHPSSSEFQSSSIAEHRVYVNYQSAIHHDPPDSVNFKQFHRFLIDGGLCCPPNATSTIDYDLQGTSATRQPLGQFHQQYWIDNERLIAVGVIDLLPAGLSSVYLFYEPEFAFLQLGTFTALVEIDFVSRLARSIDEQSARFYYMGFYQHRCRKMRYKARFSGSQLLCPVAFSWQPIERCLPILDRDTFARFSPATDADRLSVADRSRTQLAAMLNVVVGGQSYRLKRVLSKLSPEFVKLIEEFARLIGGQLLPTVKVVLG